MKQLILIISVFFSINSYSQDDKTVTLVTSGQGKTSEEAKQNALRSAIEQSFGAFISSKTEVFNDNLVKDEIVSVANGNINKFDIVSESSLLEGGYSTTIKAVVSLSKIVNFCKEKGLDVEFNGELFAFNIQQQLFNEKNELIIIENLKPLVSQTLNKCFNYKLIVSEPKVSNNNSNYWKIPINVVLTVNENFINFSSLLFNTIKAISLDKNELESYKKLNKSIYPVSIAIDNKTFGQFYLRNESSILLLTKLIFQIRDEIYKLNLSNGIDTFSVLNNSNISDLMFNEVYFRPILTKGNDGGWCGICFQSLFNNVNNSCHGKTLYIPLYVNLDDKHSTYDDFPRTFRMLDIEYDLDKSQNCNDLFEKSKGFHFLSNFVKKEKNGFVNSHFGLVISFINFIQDNPLLEMIFNDIRSIDDLKRIKKYYIIR